MSVYRKLLEHKAKYPLTIAWRMRAHAKVIEKHLNSDEEVLYAFCAQKNDNIFDIISTYAIVLTNKRLILGTKRVLFGYFFTSVTPDMFNDLKIEKKIIWGKVFIDTIKEFIVLSNIDKNALVDIETTISNYMMDEKKSYNLNISSRIK